MFLLHPYFLLLLIAVLPVVAMLRERKLVATLSGVCLALAILALARPIVFVGRARAVTVLVVDASPAADPGVFSAAQKFLNDSAQAESRPSKVIAYSNRAVVLDNLSDLGRDSALRSVLNAPLWPDDPVGGGSALAAALQLAGAQIPRGAEGRIVLFGTGLQTRGDAEAEAYRLGERGIPMLANPSRIGGDHPAAIIQQLALPATGHRGETVNLRVDVESLLARDAKIDIAVGHGAAIAKAVALPRGNSNWTYPIPLHEGGNVRVSVTLDDTGPQNADIFVSDAARILVVEPSTESGAAAELAAILGDSAKIEIATPADLIPDHLQGVSAVALCDVPASELSASAQKSLLEAVNRGTGLFVSGAARSFGPGGYDDTALAAALPVRSDEKIQQIDPSVAVVLIIDTSGSMYGEKLDLAKEMSRLIISHLRPDDKIGVIEFFAGMRWAAPLQPVGDGQQINRAIGRLTAGGDNLLYPAIEEAGDALENISAKTKHILIMSDGFVEFSPFAALAQSLGEDGISISGAACMPAPGDRNVMPDLARWGNGHYYNVVDRFNIPDIRFKEPRPSPISPIVSTPSIVQVGEDAPARLIGSGPLPDVDGYVRTKPKPTGDILLKAGDGSPLLARWRYGGGYVAALTTQLGSSMTRDLHDDPAFARLMASLFRQLTSTQPAQPFGITTIKRPAGIEIAAQWLGRLESAPKSIDVSLVDAGGVEKQSEVAAIQPGRWNVLYGGVASGDYSIGVDGGGQHAAAAIAVNPPRTFPRLSSGADFLRRLEEISSDESLNRHEPVMTARAVELRDYLIPAVVLLLIGQVALRRWPNRSDPLGSVSAP